MSAEKPFTLSVPDDALQLLRSKLDLVRFPDELDDAGWDYGAPLSDIKRLVSHWRDGFDWKSVEAHINKLPMFTRDIDVEGYGTLNIHYIHQTSEVRNAVPLLFVHGWPSHFLEVHNLLPILTSETPDHPSFHIVAPSLPGFGFSEAPKKPGLKGPQYAELLNKLMLSLGYDEYVYQGGDWGFTLGAHAVTRYGHKHVKAWHTNMPMPSPPTLFKSPLLYLGKFFLPFDRDAQERIATSMRNRSTMFGYFWQQATRPQTLGYGLADSPVGLLAWIDQKLIELTDEYAWTDEQVLEWISIYWFARAGPSASIRIYYEMTNGGVDNPTQGVQLEQSTVPVGVSYFPGEPIRLPKSWSQLLGKLVFESDHEKGGHFAAFEVPELLAGDIRRMFGKEGPAYGVVPGRSGYAADS